MKIVELILDEEQEFSGIEAISIVENPAIEEDFITLNSDQEIKLAEVSKEKRILMGALLIPNKPIYRLGAEGEYYIYFSRETIEKASQMYLMKGNQANSTLEHEREIQGLCLVESWIVDNPENDKSNAYGMNMPKGTWMGSVKVTNDDIWNEYVKTGKVKGFSIEGYFAEKAERPKESLQEALEQIEQEEGEYILSQIKGIVRQDKRRKDGKTFELESYADYPKGVSNNAKRGINLNEKSGNKCATQVGKVRAQQLAKGEAVSIETIKRMYSYLSRAEEYYDEGDTKACGTISYLLWGGKAGKRWAESKLKELDLIDLSEPCWDDYEQIGWKKKNGKLVPNCVPKRK